MTYLPAYPTPVPYDADLHGRGGAIFRITVGRGKKAAVVSGSTERLEECVDDLANGVHADEKLQAAFDMIGLRGLGVVRPVVRKTGESDRDYAGRLEMWLQAEFNETLGKDVRNSGYHKETLKAKWAEPEFRSAQVERLTGRVVGDETRERMANAKRGARNHQSRACEVGGRAFDCVSDAAREFGVTQQAMQQWLTGATPWPGTGLRKSRRPDLEGLTGRFV